MCVDNLTTHVAVGNVMHLGCLYLQRVCLSGGEVALKNECRGGRSVFGSLCQQTEITAVRGEELCTCPGRAQIFVRAHTCVCVSERWW